MGYDSESQRRYGTRLMRIGYDRTQTRSDPSNMGKPPGNRELRRKFQRMMDKKTKQFRAQQERERDGEQAESDL